MGRALGFWRDLLGLELLGRGVVEYDYVDQIVGLDGARIEWAELALPGGGLVELFRYLKPPGRPLGGGVNDPGKTHLCLEGEDLDGLLAKLHTAGTPSAHSSPVGKPTGKWPGWPGLFGFAPGCGVGGSVERTTRSPPPLPAPRSAL